MSDQAGSIKRIHACKIGERGTGIYYCEPVRQGLGTARRISLSSPAYAQWPEGDQEEGRIAADRLGTEVDPEEVHNLVEPKAGQEVVRTVVDCLAVD